MNLILSDTTLPDALPLNKDTRYIDLSALNIKNCIGCFGCWVKTPGNCVIRDDAVKVYPLIAKSRRILYISRLCYGCYDTVMKTMLERAIPIQQAFIRLHNGETHHVQRSVVPKDAVILAYGDISEEEKLLFRKLVARNANNMLFHSWEIQFINEHTLTQAILKELRKWGI